MGNVESFRKNSKISAFLTKTGEENYFWQKLSQQAAELNGVPSISAKISAFPSLLQTRLENVPFAL